MRSLSVHSRSLRLLWLCALLLLIAVCLYPVSTRLTRGAGILLVLVVWFGALAIAWRHTGLRAVMLLLTFGFVAFAAAPGRANPSADALRNEYVAALRRFEGARYVWGGENHLGIDCSGLARRALIEALLIRSLRELDPGRARDAIALWWNDCTAAGMKDGIRSLTYPVAAAPKIAGFNHQPLSAGDLAVTENGLHVLIYLGDETWIEADPLLNRVVCARADDPDNTWLHGPMRITRWRLLQPPG